MAEIIANLTEPFVLETIEAVQGLPVGALGERGIINEVIPGLSPPYLLTNRFPTPPTAAAFLGEVFALEEDPIVIYGLDAPYYITGALVPEGDFLEPTQGQIWPRIG